MGKLVELERLQRYDSKIKNYIKSNDNNKLNNSGVDTFDGTLSVSGSLKLPNSPQTPETSQPTPNDAEIRQTANATTTGLTVVDGSDAIVNKISGNTVKCENFINVDAMVNSAFVKNADGSYTLTKNGSDRFSATFNCNIPAGNYIGCANIISSSTVGSVYFSLIVKFTDGTSKTYPYSKTSNRVWIQTNKTISSIDVYMESSEADGCYTTFKDFMFNSYTDVANPYLPYQPYFTGLKNAQISGIKSTGRNLWTSANLLGQCTVADASNKLKISNTSGYTGFYIPVAPNTNYTISYNKIYDIVFAFSSGIVEGSDIIGGARLINSGQSVTKNSENAKYLIVTKWTSSMPADFSVMVNIGSTALPYEPYTESTMQLPQTVELGKWDYIENGQIVKNTDIIVLDGTENWAEEEISSGKNFYIDTPIGKPSSICIVSNNNFVSTTASTSVRNNIWISNSGRLNITADGFNTVAEWKTYITQLYANGNSLTVAYQLATSTYEPITFNNRYTVYDNGVEQIITPKEDGYNCFYYGANPTVTATYSIMENPTEAANKAYVINGLAKKLDKTGGTITGSLIVKGRTDLTLGAIIAEHNGIVYGLVYDGDSYKLGEGLVDDNGNFIFKQDEGLPIALRDDSDLFRNNELVVWSDSGNKFVSSGVKFTQISTLTTEVNQNKQDIQSIKDSGVGGVEIEGLD